MPIETACPHCGKKYRLKDELAGRRATCSSPECRRHFTVPGTSIPAEKARPGAPKKPLEDRSLMEAEALAAALFGDDPNAGKAAAAEQTVEVVCSMCDHKWAEPASKVGKNVICPECKHRQKIVERKVVKADWRDPNADRPGGARGPELPEELKAQRTTQAQFESLKQAGAIADDVEPVPLIAKLKWFALGLAALIVLAVGAWVYFDRRQDGKENTYMAEAVKEVGEFKDDGPMAKGQPALCRALLLIAAGEYAARSDSKEKRKEAIGHFGQARDELQKAPKSPERDLLIGELALAMLALGGDEDQVAKEQRIRWSQQDHQTKRDKIQGDFGYVQQHLLRVLNLLKAEFKPDDLDLRLSIARRLARELTKLGQFDLLQEILMQAFTEGEIPEATAQVALESLAAGAPVEKVQPIAESLKATIGAGGNFAPTPISAQVLWQKLGIAGAPSLVGPPGAGELTRYSRLAAVGSSIQQKNASEALALATRPGQLDDRLFALAMIAEQSSEPMGAVDAAIDIASKERAAFGKTSPQFAILRLVQAAARAGQSDKVDKLAELLADDGLRAWAKADALRLKLAANPKQKAGATQLDRPDDASKMRVSAGLAALAVARHNSDRGAAKEYETWGAGRLRGFGLAGLALGLQDNKR